jgi:hypothetical protein
MQTNPSLLTVPVREGDYLGLSFEKYLSNKDITAAQGLFYQWRNEFKNIPNLNQACHYLQTNLRKHQKFSTYLITAAAQQLIYHQQVDKALFNKLITGACIDATYLLSKDEFVRFSVRGKEVAGLAVRYTTNASGKKKLSFHPFNVDFAEDYNGEELIHGNTLATDYQVLLTQTISFVEFGTEVVNFVNETKALSVVAAGNAPVPAAYRPYLVVGADWNAMIIRTAPATVRGHYRNQPCGKQRQSIKRVWIADHSRSGYQRQAGKARSLKGLRGSTAPNQVLEND